jgi:hypothetical protein
VGSTTLAPGQETPLILDLPMGMHSGMEGQHLFRITVLAYNGGGESGALQVYFKANFR